MHFFGLKYKMARLDTQLSVLGTYVHVKVIIGFNVRNKLLNFWNDFWEQNIFYLYICILNIVQHVLCSNYEHTIVFFTKFHVAILIFVAAVVLTFFKTILSKVS